MDPPLCYRAARRVSGESQVAGANLTNANLSGAKLTNGNLSDANLAGANLIYVASGFITGTPAALPNEWHLLGGYLIGPYANLTYANLFREPMTGFNLSGANLSGANLSGSNLAGANLSGANLYNPNPAGVTWSNTTCPDGTNSSAYSPQTCIGHGI